MFFQKKASEEGIKRFWMTNSMKHKTGDLLQESNIVVSTSAKEQNREESIEKAEPSAP